MLEWLALSQRFINGSINQWRRRLQAVVQENVDIFYTQAQLEMWANAQRDGRPAEYTWRLLFNAAKFG